MTCETCTTISDTRSKWKLASRASVACLRVTRRRSISSVHVLASESKSETWVPHDRGVMAFGEARRC